MKAAYAQVARTVGVCVCLSYINSIGWAADGKPQIAQAAQATQATASTPATPATAATSATSAAATFDATAPDAAEKAMQLASKYAQHTKLNWGKAESAVIHGVQQDPQARRDNVDGTSWVFFKTPKAEEEILWKRVLIVKPDGTVLNLRGTANKPDQFSPKKAKHIAMQYAALRKLNWGKPEREVDRKDADTYCVFFPTPEKEEQVTSKRVLIVKRDGSIADQPRRR